MTPQSSFMILAAVKPEREAELRRLLDSMNDAPGRTNPDNELLPFRQFDTLHFMRLLIVDDKTVDDVRVYGMVPRTYPLYLALAGDIDGDVDAFLAEMAARVPAGLRAIFSCCDGFAPGADLVRWMQAHNVPNAASYVNWRGRTVRQVHEEAALHDALERHIENEFARLDRRPAQEIHATLRRLDLGGRGSRTTDAVPRTSDTARLAASQFPPSRRRPRARPARAPLRAPNCRRCSRTPPPFGEDGSRTMSADPGGA